MAQHIYTTLENLCIRCSEAIFNPICPSCLLKQIEEWLKEKYPKKKNQIIKKIKQKIKRDELAETLCIKCKQPTNICPYCFIELVKQEIDIDNDFLTFFNFDFG